MDDGFLELGVQGRLEKATDRTLHWASGPGSRAWWSSWIDRSSPSLREWQFQMFEAFKWKVQDFWGFRLRNDLAVPGDFYSNISVARSVGKLGDGPVRKCQTASSAQRHNHELNPSPRYALAKLLVQKVQNG